MTKQNLLQAVENLSYSERVRRLAIWGRESRTHSNLAALAELQTGDFYERWLALLANSGTRNSAQALAALKDPSRLIRNAALKQVAAFCTKAELDDPLATASTRQRAAILLLLRKAQRQRIIDSELERLYEQNSLELPALLAYGPMKLPQGYFPPCWRC